MQCVRVDRKRRATPITAFVAPRRYDAPVLARPPASPSTNPWTLALAAALVAILLTPSDLQAKPFAIRQQKLQIGKRVAQVFVPPRHPPKHRLPVVLLLHGYGSDGLHHAELLGYRALQRRVGGFLLLVPDGLKNRIGRRFFNATEACCDFHRQRPDDVAFLGTLIERTLQQHRGDRRRVYVVGHSNGGYMAYRLACTRANLVAAVVSLAGATFARASDCKPARPVSVLQIHGDQDEVVHYAGGRLRQRRKGSRHAVSYPGAKQTVALWARYDRCRGRLRATATALDLVTDVAGGKLGPETQRQHFTRCPPGVDVALWTMQGGAHTPKLTPAFARETWRWLKLHRQTTRSSRRPSPIEGL